MIPKIIHYCWFGHNPLPELAKRCIASWHKYLPDYEIREWNEDNFDVDIIPYTSEAYKAKKYAFVSDYARFWILYNHGGIYFDTDVEVIRPMDDIIARGSFMGCENYSGDKGGMIGVAPGLGLGANSGLDLYRELLDVYSNLSFYNQDGSQNIVTIVKYTTDILIRHGLKNINEIQEIASVLIYPAEYFCPKSNVNGELTITPQTVSIHHYQSSWASPQYKIRKYLRQKLGQRWASIILFDKFRKK